MTPPQPTPEEKLFAVIQGAKGSSLRARSGERSLGKIGARLWTAVGPLDLTRVNQALMGLLGMLALLCLIQPLVMRPRVSRLIHKTRELRVPLAPPPLEGLRPLDEYVQTVAQADPFRVGETPFAPPPVATPPETPAIDPQTLTSGLKLVGISWGAEPVAMIEQGEQTHVLKAGQQLGEITVKDILQDRVLLRIGGQDVELF